MRINDNIFLERRCFFMKYTISIDNLDDFILYLDDIDNYVDSILYYHQDYNNNLDLIELLSYLSSVHEIIENLKLFIYENLYESKE